MVLKNSLTQFFQENQDTKLEANRFVRDIDFMKFANRPGFIGNGKEIFGDLDVDGLGAIPLEDFKVN